MGGLREIKKFGGEKRIDDDEATFGRPNAWNKWSLKFKLINNDIREQIQVIGVHEFICQTVKHCQVVDGD